jgi:hypothetical protein
MPRTKIEILENRFDYDRMPTLWESPVVGEHRRDTYAENNIGEGIYRDTGCKFAESCLRCPYSECVNTTETQKRYKRNAAICADYAELKRQGKPYSKPLVKKYGVSSRTLWRVIDAYKKGQTWELPEIKPKESFYDAMIAPFFKARAPLPPLPVRY